MSDPKLRDVARENFENLEPHAWFVIQNDSKRAFILGFCHGAVYGGKTVQAIYRGQLEDDPVWWAEQYLKGNIKNG